MFRQLFAGAPVQRALPIPGASFKAPIARQPCLLSKQNPTSPTTRAFSQTSPACFTPSAIQRSSPFRLSSEKHPYPYPEDDPYSQYQPKRKWPPDMSKLSQKHQFRLERKYRRRAALKYARPNFIKMVTLAQWIIIGFVGIYAVLFMEWDTKDTPFDGIRESVFSSVRAVSLLAPASRSSEAVG
ncbi:hypothetical protein N7468_006881 [Penicillium chermesinum]|uniref:Uncharacterized protein n=1 Tax=Penicillium chermesinum TaxID=63820 RepID=A0A9W9NTS4_9EURO|nr:uncharacterized protein N7468_006881 [Penicillium chermesinum]KAJ5225656.1 hypothetical protein N7468_006881 [Penicillium chermesinum]